MVRVLLQNLWDAIDTKRGAVTALIIIYFTGALITILVIDHTAYGPVHFGDELRYWNTAISLFDGTFTVEENYHHPPLYSLSLLPALILCSKYQVYAAAKILNALYLMSVIFPIYFLLRKFQNRRESILSVVLMLLLPVHLVIPRSILSENIYYPLFMWAILLSFTNVLPTTKKNRILEDAILAILLAFMMLTRYISLAVIPALLFIWWLKPCVHRGDNRPSLISLDKVKHFLIILFSFALIMGFWLAAGIREGIPVRNLFGLFIAENSDPAQLGRRRLLMWMVFYACFVVLLAGPSLPVLLASVMQFNFHKWRENFNRWWIALAVLLAAFMIACVRHSWKAWYNYPTPSRIQGRYIFYFGPLFMITAIISIRKLLQIKIKPIFLFILTILSSGLIFFSYSVYFNSLIFLDHPLRISISSPFGYILTSLNEKFIYLTGLLIFLIVLYIYTKNKKLAGLIVFLVCAFYIYSGINIYQLMLMPRQRPNIQIAQIIKGIENSDELLADFRTSHLVFNVNPEISTNQIHRWGYTLFFNGYTDHEFNKNEVGGWISSVVLDLRFSNVSIDLRKVGLEEFNDCDCEKFVLSDDDYFIIEGLSR